MADPFTKIPGLGVASELIQGNVAGALGRSEPGAVDITAGRLLEDVDVLNGSFTSLEHQLGRAWRGFFVVKAEADVRVWSEDSSDDALFLRVQSSANATVSLWVF